jgi:hypothetical protein
MEITYISLSQCVIKKPWRYMTSTFDLLGLSQCHINLGKQLESVVSIIENKMYRSVQHLMEGQLL